MQCTDPQLGSQGALAPERFTDLPATAHLPGIDPFDRPAVKANKVLART